jgi:hypothetical protein
MEREIAHIKRLYPHARCVGVADGARSNRDFLEPHVEEQILDFYHASEYVSQAADAIFSDDPAHRRIWMEEHCSTLKHDWNGARKLLAEWKTQDTTGWHTQTVGSWHTIFRQPLASDALQTLSGLGHANWLGGDRSGMQNLDQAALMLLGNALERKRGTSHSQLARPANDVRAVASILAKGRTVWPTKLGTATLSI